MYKNIIFDFDGVIINSHDVQLKALKESFTQICGEGEPPCDLFFKHSGESLENIFNYLNLPLEMIPIYKKISHDNIGMIKIHEGMLDLLSELKEHGYACALCTGKDRKRTIQILEYFNIAHLFKTIVCSDDVIHPKPHPESLVQIMMRLGALSEDTVMVGDGINDILAARNGGIKSIAVTWGDLNEKTLKEKRPDIICSSVIQLRNTLLNASVK